MDQQLHHDKILIFEVEFGNIKIKRYLCFVTNNLKHLLGV